MNKCICTHIHIHTYTYVNTHTYIYTHLQMHAQTHRVPHIGCLVIFPVPLSSSHFSFSRQVWNLHCKCTLYIYVNVYIHTYIYVNVHIHTCTWHPCKRLPLKLVSIVPFSFLFFGPDMNCFVYSYEVFCVPVYKTHTYHTLEMDSLWFCSVPLSPSHVPFRVRYAHFCIYTNIHLHIHIHGVPVRDVCLAPKTKNQSEYVKGSQCHILLWLIFCFGRQKSIRVCSEYVKGSRCHFFCTHTHIHIPTHTSRIWHQLPLRLLWLFCSFWRQTWTFLYTYKHTYTYTNITYVTSTALNICSIVPYSFFPFSRQIWAFLLCAY